MRIAVGTFSQETNTFSPVETDLAAFERAGYYVGDDFELRPGGWRSALGSFVEVAQERGGVELVPLVHARLGANGRLTRRAFDEITGRFLEQLRGAGTVDAVYLELHGAMAAEHHDDPEGLLLESVREVVGPAIPVFASTDHHANVTERMLANADVIVGHRTQPHDPPHTGAETARLLFQVVDEGIRPAVAMRKAPMITHQEQYLTNRPPMKIWFDQAREMEQRPRVLSVSTYPMQPWLDVEEGGWASIVYTDQDPALADELAKELTRTVWDLREDLMVTESVGVEEAVRRADAAPSGVVVLSDTGDSMLGGSAGDSNVILAELLRQQVEGTALVPLVDEPAALRAAQAGEGATVDLQLGRSLDPRWGEPIDVTAEVVTITDGRVEEPDGSTYEQGVSALVRIGEVLVGISQYRGRGGVHPVMWQHFGVDATDRDEIQCVVVKTASNFQYFADVTSELIRVDTPGHTQSRVTEFEWSRLPRPAFPLDPDATLSW